jgi:hypothetical protein
LLVTFAVPGEYLALPDNTQEVGDKVRISSKEPGQTARFMNLTGTDIFKQYTRCQKFFLPPLTLTLSPRWGERA